MRWGSAITREPDVMNPVDQGFHSYQAGDLAGLTGVVRPRVLRSVLGHNGRVTDLLYLRDAYLTSMDATVVAVDGKRVALDRTVFYPTGGGQPHDTGTLGRRRRHRRSQGGRDWSGTRLDGPLPEVGQRGEG